MFQNLKSLTPARIAITGALIALGALGAWAAVLLGLPMPFMLGSLLATTTLTLAAPKVVPRSYEFPKPLRIAFIGLIGVTIGLQVTRELLAKIPGLGPNILAIIVFVLAAQALGYLIYRRWAKYDAKTALYAAAPGGLLECIALAEAHKADVTRVTLLHFLRIIWVIILLPIGLSWYHGRPLGSAAGLEAGTAAAMGISGLATAVVLAIVGFQVGKALRLPANQLMGPLILTAVVTAGFGYEFGMATWVVAVAQVVVGCSLGLQFHSINRAMLAGSAIYSLLANALVLAMGLLVAWGLAQVTGTPTNLLLIAFAPGGIAEMSLIALSLAGDSAFVVLHHLLRIFATVFTLSGVKRWLS